MYRILPLFVNGKGLCELPLEMENYQYNGRLVHHRKTPHLRWKTLQVKAKTFRRVIKTHMDWHFIVWRLRMCVCVPCVCVCKISQNENTTAARPATPMVNTTCLPYSCFAGRSSVPPRSFPTTNTREKRTDRSGRPDVPLAPKAPKQKRTILSLSPQRFPVAKVTDEYYYTSLRTQCKEFFFLST